MMPRSLFFLCLSIPVALSGCGRAVPSGQMYWQVNYDAGRFTSEVISFSLPLSGKGTRTIDSFYTTCGCVTLLLNKGESIDCSGKVKVMVVLPKNKETKESQGFTIHFTDETVIDGTISYEYVPDPFFAPENVRFFKDISEKDVVLSLPGEMSMSIRDISLPRGLKCETEEQVNGTRKEIYFHLSLDRALFDGDPIGTIDIGTDSDTYPLFSLPYLVLK